MNSQDDEADDELTRAYRRASDAEAGRPDPAVRAAVLAEARAAALRRTPAANDRRFLWRAVAGVAVLGVAVLLWREVQVPLTPLANVAAPVPQSDLAAEDAGAAAPAANVQAKQAQSETRTDAAEAQQAAPAAAPSAARSLTVPFVPAPAAPVRREAMDETLKAARSTGLAQGIAGPAAAELFRLHFPAEFRSATPPPGLWMLQDDAGRILRSGTLDANEDFDALLARLQRELPERVIGPWEVTAVNTAGGVPVQVGIARAR
jgi:hypothetical protein